MLDTNLIPSPAIIQERLARNYREAQLLRSLLRIANQAARHRLEHALAYPRLGERNTHTPPRQAKGRAVTR